MAPRPFGSVPRAEPETDPLPHVITFEEPASPSELGDEPPLDELHAAAKITRTGIISRFIITLPPECRLGRAMAAPRSCAATPS
jgi:hypothetical protein